VSLWSRTGEWTTKFLFVVASIGLLIAMVTVVINVVGRAFFGMPLLGTVEIVGLSGVFLIPLAMVVTEKKRGHIQVEMLTERFSPRVQSLVFGVGACLVNLLTVALLIWGGALQLEDSLVRPDMVTPVLRLPKAPFIAVWIVGCLFLFAYIVQHLVGILTKGERK
jgi:TRAP-type C4-dicarboxylate transport system permease small subunit